MAITSLKNLDRELAHFHLRLKFGAGFVVLLIGWLAINPPGGLEILLVGPSSVVLWFLVAGFLRLWHGKSLRDPA